MREKPLADRSCGPCEGTVSALPNSEIQTLMTELDAWRCVDDHHLERDYRFKDFKSAWAALDRVAQLAEDSWHHPDLELAWGRLSVKIWTHKIDGLSEADFVFAARCDRLFDDGATE